METRILMVGQTYKFKARVEKIHVRANKVTVLLQGIKVSSGGEYESVPGNHLWIKGDKNDKVFMKLKQGSFASGRGVAIMYTSAGGASGTTLKLINVH